MTGISAYEHRLAAFYHDQVSRLPGVRVWGPDFSSRARAPTVSITLQGHTATEAATALGVSKRTAESRWTHARAWLRRVIEDDRRQKPDEPA